MAKQKLITHNGKFHTDDVFACATLCLMLESKRESYEIIRTRDEEIVRNGDYVFDVGGIHDADNNKFDHHQVGGAGKRENGIEYASFGLVWSKYGAELCGSKKVADYVDEKMIASIDAEDNGVDIFATTHDNILPYSIWNITRAFLPTWKEGENELDNIFLDVVDFAKKILQREITRAKAKDEAEVLVEKACESAVDKRLIILDAYYPWQSTLMKYPEPLFVVIPVVGGRWNLQTIQVAKDSFKSRKDLPKDWAGLMNEDLQKVTGVPDAVFCHRSLFLAVASSKEGILKLAELALKS